MELLITAAARALAAGDIVTGFDDWFAEANPIYEVPPCDEPLTHPTG